MAGLTFFYRSTKSPAPLTARLRFRHEGKDYTYDSKTSVVVSKLYWEKYHSKQRISDPEIKNEKIRVGSELNAIEKNRRSYLYELKKLRYYTKTTTFSIQAEVRDIMEDTLDALCRKS